MVTEKMPPVHPGEVLSMDYDLELTEDRAADRIAREVRQLAVA